VQFSATSNGQAVSSPAWSVNGTQGGSTATGTISSSGLYTAPATPLPSPVQVRISDPLRQTTSAPVPVTLYDTNNPATGSVAATNNPLVAIYSITAPPGATAQVQFGMSTNYGLMTAPVAATANGGTIQVQVAGMRAATPYHMQATVTMAGGQTVVNPDVTFMTGALPAGVFPHMTVQQTPGLTPADGVESFCLFEDADTALLTAVVSDLSGNVIWYYGMQPGSPYPIKLLANGHFAMVTYDYNPNALQEIDLAGNLIWQVTYTDVNNGLANIGSSIVVGTLHHDFAILPNGHYMLLGNQPRMETDQSGNTTQVVGDVLIDWDPQKGPVWTWSAFDHIPLSHAPNGTNDWTHANAVVYSPDDGNILLSMRNQNWVVKINYQNGQGDGTILWHMGGPDGDFTLPSGQSPIEWNYGQHYPTFQSPNTSGIIDLMVFNNGNGRIVDSTGDPCGTPGLTACYSSVPTYRLNETTKTAEVLDELKLPDFSFCCGNANVLSNGDYEYDVALPQSLNQVSYIQEMTHDATPQLVWQMNISGQLAYRGFRIPSLYPGVTWTQQNILTANTAAKAPVKTGK
jgi:arylsulfate sulfotransferase